MTKRRLELEEVKRIYLDILVELDNYCEKNNIEYFLFYGTLLGAIRHQGFIPWDDDVDVIMPRKDYNKFIHNFVSREKGKYKVIRISNEEMINTKISYLALTTSEEYLDNVKEPISGFIHIDIFPLDDIPNDKKRRNIFLRKINFLLKLNTAKSLCTNKSRGLLKNTIISIARFSLFFISSIRIRESLDRIAQKYSNNEGVGKFKCVLLDSTYFPKYFNSKNFLEYEKQTFEGVTLRVPRGYDEILTTLYGEYKILPPEDKRKAHNPHLVYYITDERK